MLSISMAFSLHTSQCHSVKCKLTLVLALSVLSIVRCRFDSMHLQPTVHQPTTLTACLVLLISLWISTLRVERRNRIVSYRFISFRYAENTLRIISFGLPWSQREQTERHRAHCKLASSSACLSLSSHPQRQLHYDDDDADAVIIAFIDSKGIVKLSTKNRQTKRKVCQIVLSFLSLAALNC